VDGVADVRVQLRRAQWKPRRGRSACAECRSLRRTLTRGYTLAPLR
jgi:hypothetical protein